jgi:hypothetical protein
MRLLGSYEVWVVRTDVSEERIASIIRVVRIDELGTTLAVTSNAFRMLVIANVVPSLLIFTLIMQARHSFEALLHSRATRSNISADGILLSHRRGNLKSYIALTGRALLRRRNVSTVRYELGCYIPEDGFLLRNVF